MVKGRLPRESNPLPGDKSGFVASHDTTGAEDYKRTSPLNPLPVKSIGDSNVKDAAVKAELELIKQGIADNKATNDLILARLDGTIDTQLTGSNVEQDVNVLNYPSVQKTEITGVTESIPTEILKANMSQDFLRNEVIAANGFKIISVDFLGTKIGVGVRFSSSTPHKINFQYVSPNSETSLSNQSTVIEGTGSRGICSFELDLNRGQFIIRNEGETDITILRFTVVDFMSGTDGGSQL